MKIGKFTIIFLILMIFISISLVSSMYSGETYIYNTDIKNLTWNVTGNSSNLEGLKISHINNQIIIDIALNFKPDNFTITFYENKEEVVTYSSNHRSGVFIPVNNTIKTTINEYYPIIKKQENNSNEDSSDVPQEIDESNLGFYTILIILGLAIIVLIILIVYRLKERREIFEIPKGNELDERREE